MLCCAMLMFFAIMPPLFMPLRYDIAAALLIQRHFAMLYSRRYYARRAGATIYVTQLSFLLRLLRHAIYAAGYEERCYAILRHDTLP